MLRSLPREILIAVRVTLVFAVVTGLAYPLAITGVGQVLFHNQANGSLITNKNGQVVGSKLIGQWVDPDNLNYFHPRPSATLDPATGKPLPYAANNSAGSNLGPSNQTLIDRITKEIAHLRGTEYKLPADGVPPDMVTTSFSGLDPDISVANAMIQADRVARVRGLDPAKVRALVDEYTQGRILWVFGQPRVNVLQLDMALDNGEAR
jgi:potassium-transporting ATPase KdpC subunit